VADESTEAFRRFHGALYAQQPEEGVGPFPDNSRLTEVARQAGVAGKVPDCISSGRYTEMAKGLAAATKVQSTPTIRINGEDYSPTTPDALVAKIKEIVGDVPGLEAAPPVAATPMPMAPPPAPAPAPAP
jgi:protein-disulfide isomerase